MSKNVAFSYFTHLINKLYRIKWFETCLYVRAKCSNFMVPVR